MKLNPDQLKAVEHINSRDYTLLIGPTGSGKTATILHALSESIRTDGRHKILVACPPKVVGHWIREVITWQLPLTILACTGTPAQRLNILTQPHDIMVVSLNNLPWALKHYKASGLVLDEIKRFAGGATLKALRHKHKHFTYVIGCTATPVEDEWRHLYGQCMAIDGGESLGTRKDRFLATYFDEDFNGYDYTLRPGADKQIMARIADMTFVLPNNKKKELLSITHNTVWFDLPEQARDLYEKLKHDMLLEINSTTVAPPNLAVVSSKLRQIACGFLYDNHGVPIPLHTARYDLARRWAAEGGGVMVFEYKEDLEHMHQLCPEALVMGGQSGKSAEKILQWLRPGMLLLMHHKAGSHGVDGLQKTQHRMLLFTPLWSRDSTQQLAGRLWRTGQNKPVTITTLAANNTVDAVVLDRVDGKGGNMPAFLKHLKE